MENERETWWSRHKGKVLLAAGIVLGSTVTMLLLGRTEEEIELEAIEYDELPVDSGPDEEDVTEEDDTPMAL